MSRTGLRAPDLPGMQPGRPARRLGATRPVEVSATVLVEPAAELQRGQGAAAVLVDGGEELLEVDVRADLHLTKVSHGLQLRSRCMIPTAAVS